MFFQQVAEERSQYYGFVLRGAEKEGFSEMIR
jgi:hypothetical protein